MLEKAKVDNVISLYNDGINNTEISKQLDIPTTTIHYVLKRNGLKNRISQNWTIIDENIINEIIQLNNKGLTQKEIARHFKIDVKRLIKIYKNNNIKSKSNAKFSKNGFENFIARLYEKTQNWDYIDGYINDNSKVRLRCKKCGNIIERWASSVRQYNDYICEQCIISNRLEKKKNKQLQKEYKRQCHNLLKSEQLSFFICKHCGNLFVGTGNQKTFCSKRCRDRHHEQQKSRARIKKAKLNGTVDYTITLDKLIKRDNNKCYLCGGECNLNDYVMINNTKVAGNYYPSIEHITPIAKGGTHTWNNIKLAHRICNINKGDKTLPVM